MLPMSKLQNKIGSLRPMEDNRLLCKTLNVLLMKNTLCINGCCSINLTDKRNVKLNLANNQKMLPPPFLFP